MSRSEGVVNHTPNSLAHARSDFQSRLAQDLRWFREQIENLDLPDLVSSVLDA